MEILKKGDLIQVFGVIEADYPRADFIRKLFDADLVEKQREREHIMLKELKEKKEALKKKIGEMSGAEAIK